MPLCTAAHHWQALFYPKGEWTQNNDYTTGKLSIIFDYDAYTYRVIMGAGQ